MIAPTSPAGSRMNASRSRFDKIGDDKDGASSVRSRSASRGTLRHADPAEAAFGPERQSLLHCLSDTNRTVTRLMFEKDKLAERLSRTQAEATKELSGMRLKLDATAHEANSLRAALREKTVEYDAVQTAMFDAKNELADVKSSTALRIVELEAANREQQSQLQDLQRDLEDYRRRLQSKNQDVYAREQELLKERELHEVRIQRLQQQLDKAQRSLKHNKASRELEDQLQTALANIEALKRTIRTQQEEAGELRAEAVTKRSSATNRVKELQAENASLKAQLEFHAADTHRAREEVRQLQSELASRSSQFHALQTELHDTQADLKFLQEAGDGEIQRQVAAIEARLAANPGSMKMVADLQAENADLRTAVNKVQRTNTELQSVVESYHSDLESLTGEAQRLVTTVASQDTTIREYQQRIQELEQKAQASASLTDSVEAQVRRATGSLREELRKKDEELTQTFALATDLNKQREELVALVRELTTSEEKHASTVSQLSAAVTSLRAEHEAVKAERSALLSERQDHLSRLQEVSAERETHTKLLEALTTRLSVSSPRVMAPSGRMTVSRQSSATFTEPHADSASVSSRHTPVSSSSTVRRRGSSASARGTSPARFPARDDNPPSDPAHDALLARAKAVMRACN